MTGLRASRRLLHVALVLGVVGTLAVGFESWIPAAATVPLAGVLVLALIEVLLPLPHSGTRRVELGDRMLANDESRVDVQLDGAVLPFNLRVEDGVPEGLDIVPGSVEPTRAAGAATAVSSYRVSARRRGDHAYDAVHVHRTSVLGLFERSDDVPLPGNVAVLPPSARHLRVQVRPRPPTRQGMPAKSMRRGPGDEFFALREYLPGDSLSDVNWKATARMNRVITNEYLPDEPPRYLIYVDTRASAAERGGEDVYERSLQLAAILAEALLDARSHVGLVLLSYHSQFVVPGGGANQLRRLRQMLLGAQPGYEASIHQLVLAGVAHLPSRADAVLITPNVYDASLSEAVSFLRARHGHCIVLAPGFPQRATGDELDDAARRASAALLNAEQAAALAAIRPYADRAAQWPPGEPISVTLARLDMSGRMR